MKVSVNINESIKVKLTNEGRKVLERNERTSYLQPEEDGTLRMQLWEWAAVFGEHLYNGAPNLFVNNEIIWHYRGL